MLYLMPSHIYLSEATLANLRTNDKIADVGLVVLPVPPGGRGMPRIRHGVGRGVRRRRGGEGKTGERESSPRAYSIRKTSAAVGFMYTDV